ncbi:MAG: 1-acyl-sn-glycerol-3-phosphate acyltransferase [Planctomycetes bacterium]|nr:1-acyl-sn-glycerol-3-phosphate acyltransferase [Planctomycetota bacterium]
MRRRNVVLTVPVVLILLVWSGLIGLVALLAPGLIRPRLGAIVRPWGRFALRALGVSVELEGREFLFSDEPRIIVFNHVSLLDIPLLAAHAPDRPLVLYKRELGRVPLIGWAFRATRMIPVEREHLERAIASLQEAGRRIRAERAAVVISPEGTRSRDGRLGEFKLGTFHLARTTGVPIVPLVMHGIPKVLPHGAWIARPGTVRLVAHPPIPTEGWSAERVREYARELRALYLAELGED